MIDSLLRFTLSQRYIVILLALAIAVYGVLSYSKLVIDAFPDVSSTQVKIIIKAPGMTPAEVEQQITIPIELEMKGIPTHIAPSVEDAPKCKHPVFCISLRSSFMQKAAEAVAAQGKAK